ncbi:MAG: tRNA (adenosine(37)-N6)-threonylcarbamoyltransferase complex transferase subunit TsaD, partial [Chitinophagaceae bacterium]
YFLNNAGTSTVYKESFTATEEEKKEFIGDNLPDICASVQFRLVNILMKKLAIAVENTGIKEVCIAGGVSANSELRHQLKSWGEQKGWNTYIPKFEYCTDNAAMIAITAYYKFLKQDFSKLDVVPAARTNW